MDLAVQAIVAPGSMNNGKPIFNYQVLAYLGSNIAVIDKNGAIIAVNKCWDDFARENGDLNLIHTSIGSNYLETCSKSVAAGDPYAAQALAGIEAVFESNMPLFELEYPCDSSAEPRWFVLQVVRYDEDPTKLIISHQNITRRKRVEQALKASEIRYRRLFESAKDGILILDEKTGGIIDVNPFLIDMLDYRYEEFVGKQLWEIGLFSDMAESKKAFDELRKNKYIRYDDLPLKSKDGTIRNVEFVSNVYQENDETVIQCNIRDITEKIGVQMQLKQSLEKYRLLASRLQEESARLVEAQSIAQIGSWEIFMETLQLVWSEETYRIFDTDPETFVPTVQAFFEFVHKDDRERVRQTLESRSASGTTAMLEHRIITPKGNLKYLAQRWNMIMGPDGSPARAVGTSQDITGRKKIQMEGEELVKQLQLKNNDLRQFAYIVSHNLRAHTAKIQGLVFLINNDEERAGDMPALLRRVKDEAIRLDHVIMDLNTILSVQDSGTSNLEPVSFAEILEQVTKVLSTDIAAANGCVSAAFDKCPEVTTVKSFCYSIMFNLCSNAIKYKEPGRPLLVHFSTSCDIDFICLSVTDNGRGIDLEKNKDKIFGLYKRFHGNSIAGRGIGLNLVKSQIESLGGSAEVTSKPGVGTTFTIYFPNIQ